MTAPTKTLRALTASGALLLAVACNAGTTAHHHVVHHTVVHHTVVHHHVTHHVTTRHH